MTPCARCGTEFEKKSKRNLYCSHACRQAAYQQSPSYQALRAQKKAASQQRRRDKFKQRNYYRALGFDGRYGGPSNGPVPSSRCQLDRIDPWKPSLQAIKDAVKAKSGRIASPISDGD